MYVDFNCGVQKVLLQEKFEPKDKLMYLNRKFYYENMQK